MSKIEDEYRSARRRRLEAQEIKVVVDGHMAPLTMQTYTLSQSALLAMLTGDQHWAPADKAAKLLTMKAPDSMEVDRFVFALQVLEKFYTQLFVNGCQKANIVTVAQRDMKEPCEDWQAALQILTPVHYLLVDDPDLRRELLNSIRTALIRLPMSTHQLTLVYEALCACGSDEEAHIPLVMLRCLQAMCGEDLPSWSDDFMGVVIAAGRKMGIIPLLGDTKGTREFISGRAMYAEWSNWLTGGTETRGDMQRHVRAMWSPCIAAPEEVDVFETYAVVLKDIGKGDYIAENDFYGLMLSVRVTANDAMKRMMVRCSLDYGQAQPWRTNTTTTLEVSLRAPQPTNDGPTIEPTLFRFSLEHHEGLREHLPLVRGDQFVPRRYDEALAYLEVCVGSKEPWGWIDVIYKARV
jgi:hypothetical protein